MRCPLIISVFLLSLAYGATNTPHFYDYTEALCAHEINSFVRDLANSVPVEHRGPGTAALQEYASRTEEILKRRTFDEKADQLDALKHLYENVKVNFYLTSKETEIILPGLKKFAKENEMCSN
ncbi:uncharacterized protein LOC108092644 [Drosophila ficusphila]|uniref:uncharacterized protein LOC108092644 n=1 Tax=Drosophila ficusphila TaxID=30025 RepID=UPI0007E7E5BF|nr:uncharacterized protein LOC108092644 [Drosophila ficusphila]